MLCSFFLVSLTLGTTMCSGQCVSRTISVSRVQGAVFDRDGQPIPNVEISLRREGATIAHVETDDLGRFSIFEVPGAYDLVEKVNGFASGSARIEVGGDLIRAVRPTTLWMVLDVGVLTENCGPFVTTSKKRFERSITKHDPRTTNHGPQIEHATQK